MKFTRASRYMGLLSAARTAIAADTLEPWKFTPLPAGSVTPGGWIHGEMEAMASGLAGHEHDFYVFVNSSRWLYPQGTGGTDYSGLNEGLPYWFNGLVPLAYQLDDPTLKAQVHSVASTVLGLQTDDGWIGPEVYAERNFWARCPMFLGLTQLAEANSTWEQPIVDGLNKFMTLTNTMLNNNSQGFSNCDANTDCSWGMARIHDMVITIQWMLENHPSDLDAKLWENMQMFYDQNTLKWQDYYAEGTYQPVVTNATFGYVHGVNVGQGLKASSVFQRFLKQDSLTASTMNAIEWTFRDHGAASGTILADEAEHDLAPYMGSELCTAVETGYSLAYLYQTMGNNEFADRAERVIFNAMPVMMTGDMWAHQYMTSPSMPFAHNVTSDFENVTHIYTTANSGIANVYGMEPQYPCCTVNHPQGYPKFVSNSWVGVGSTGLGHALLGPSKVATKVNGGAVSITCDTNYPFQNTLEYNIESEQGFDLYLRVPAWYQPDTSTVQVGAKTTTVSPDSHTGMHKVSVPAGKSSITYNIGAGIRTEERSNNTVAFYHGALLYALEVGSTTTSSYPHAYSDATGPGISGLPFSELRDYYKEPTTPWNVAVDPSSAKFSPMADGDTLPVPVFGEGSPPSYITVQGCEIDWPLYLDVLPDWAPSDRTCTGKQTEFRLVPFGGAKLHMTDLPTTKF